MFSKIIINDQSQKHSLMMPMNKIQFRFPPSNILCKIEDFVILAAIIVTIAMFIVGIVSILTQPS